MTGSADSLCKSRAEKDMGWVCRSRASAGQMDNESSGSLCMVVEMLSVATQERNGWCPYLGF